MSKGTVLIIDDERDLLELVGANLSREGFEVLTAPDGAAGLELARRKAPNLIILDLMMPGMDGLEVCQQIRRMNGTRMIPIIILTAKAAEADRVVGLELGADDYVTKPFSPRELVARVKAQIRRASAARDSSELRVGELTIDASRHRATVGGESVSLTAAEFRILHLLMSRAGAVLSRQDIISHVLGPHAVVTDRIVDVHMTAIRKKLGSAGDRIETIRSFGYKLRDESDE
jgi:two-component system phosphate regulon response regulator PhoB